VIDTHAHLTKKFCQDTQKTVKRAVAAGVKKIILAASNVEESVENIDLAKKYPGVLFPAVGIHPQQTDVENKDPIVKQLEQIEKLIGENKSLVVGVGETGLDYSPAPEGEKDRTKAEQQKLFEGQIRLAEKNKLPIIVHARKTVDEVIEIIEKMEKELGPLKGVFHCWAGGKKRVERILNLKGEWYLGIDGNITYEAGLEEVLKKIPLDRLVLETDSPFLTPVPRRGKTNSPANMKFIYKKVSGILGKRLEELKKTIESNVKKLFSI
jgi:TatD DNase family protein